MPRTKFDEQLNTMHGYVRHMTELVIHSLEANFRAFLTNDEELAGRASPRDEHIDALHHQLERHVMTILAMAHPLAGRDLRDIMSSMLVAYELERMGDYAKSIGRYMTKHGVTITKEVPSELPAMKEQCEAMAAQALQAYTHDDVDIARKTVLQDETVDDLKKGLFDTTIQQIKRGELSVDEGTYLLWVGHKLERFADRCVTISKRAAYVSMGHTPFFEATDEG